MEGLELISVVIPLYNAEKFLQPLINSIVKQTYDNWEVLFVDDGSQDNSVKIVQNQILQDSRFRLYKRLETETKGAPTCRNIGMREARGEYIIFFDADDIIADFCFEQRLKGIKKSGKDFCVFPLMSFDRELNDMKEPIVLGYPTDADTFYCLIARILPFCVVTNIYRRSSLVAKEIEWDTNIKSLQDSDFNVVCITAGLTYAIIEAKPDYYWRLGGNDNSITKQIKKKVHSESHLYLFEKEYEMLKGKGYDDAFYSFYCFILEGLVTSGAKGAVNEFLNNMYMRENLFIRVRMRVYCLLVLSFFPNSHRISRLMRLLLFPLLEYKFRKTKRLLYMHRASFVSMVRLLG